MLHRRPIHLRYALTYKARGFTLIELLLVIGIIAILASVVIIAINPTKQLGTARDTQRRSDVNTILNGVYQFAIDNNGALPGYLSGATIGVDYWICNCNASYCPLKSACGIPSLNYSLNLREMTGSYFVAAIPHDPQLSDTASGTRYTIRKEPNNRVTVCTYGQEIATSSICVTR